MFLLSTVYIFYRSHFIALEDFSTGTNCANETLLKLYCSCCILLHFFWVWIQPLLLSSCIQYTCSGKCSHCKKSFAAYLHLQSHVIFFSGLQCKHLSSHSCLGRFNKQTRIDKCFQCKKSFATNLYLQSHVITFSRLQCKHLSSHSFLGRFNNQTRSDKCSQCKKSFAAYLLPAKPCHNFLSASVQASLIPLLPGQIQQSNLWVWMWREGVQGPDKQVHKVKNKDYVYTNIRYFLHKHNIYDPMCLEHEFMSKKCWFVPDIFQFQCFYIELVEYWNNFCVDWVNVALILIYKKLFHC